MPNQNVWETPTRTIYEEKKDVMIDVHCHLEQKSILDDLDDILGRCKEYGIKAIITSCANPKDFEITLKIKEKYKGFVFAVAVIHPEFIKYFSEDEIKKTFDEIRENRNKLVGVGECGLDYWYIKEPVWREKQADMFRKFIALSKELKKPLVIHARDAYEETVQILEQSGARQVMLHMFGANQLVKRVIDNGWHVSMNAIVMKSKKHAKVARDIPLDRLMLETDAPWLSPSGGRNDPRAIRAVAEKIAETKKLPFGDVWEACGRNAVSFFRLPVKI